MSRARFRFSLAELMVATFIVSLAAAALWTLPAFVTTFAALRLSFAILGMSVVGALAGSGYRWAFCVGALMPNGVLPLYLLVIGLGLGGLGAESMYVRWICLIGWGYGIISGGFGCLMYWLIERSKR